MRTRLADPDFEPTDEELMALSRAAFADVEERHRVALEHLYADIAKGVRREEVALGARSVPGALPESKS
jgi:hypothetical protein